MDGAKHRAIPKVWPVRACKCALPFFYNIQTKPSLTELVSFWHVGELSCFIITALIDAGISFRLPPCYPHIFLIFLLQPRFAVRCFPSLLFSVLHCLDPPLGWSTDAGWRHSGLILLLLMLMLKEVKGTCYFCCDPHLPTPGEWILIELCCAVWSHIEMRKRTWFFNAKENKYSQNQAVMQEHMGEEIGSSAQEETYSFPKKVLHPNRKVLFLQILQIYFNFSSGHAFRSRLLWYTR